MRRIAAVFLVSLVITLSCKEEVFDAAYYPDFPAMPAGWEEILGSPHWRLEWIDGGGNRIFSEIKEGADSLSSIEIMEEWTSPVIAWPYWPRKGIFPGQMRPAGALFPWDVSGDRILLSWNAGADAVFWRELASASEAENVSGTPRLPWLFDWPAFRELMGSENIPGEVRLDPWTADWKIIARKTVESGFDRRRIRAANRKEISVPAAPGLWIGDSPFSPPVTTLPGENLVLKTGEKIETRVSASGLLRFQGDAWIFLPWDIP